MRTLFGLAVALLLGLSWSAPANAQNGVVYSFERRQIGDWLVYGYSNKCWMIHLQRVDKTIVSLAISSVRSDLYISLENRDWTFLKDREHYSVDVIFGGGTIAKTATALTELQDTEPLLAVFVGDAGNIFTGLRRGDRVGFGLRGRFEIAVPLAGSGPAIDYFEDCARALKAGPYTAK